MQLEVKAGMSNPAYRCRSSPGGPDQIPCLKKKFQMQETLINQYRRQPSLFVINELAQKSASSSFSINFCSGSDSKGPECLNYRMLTVLGSNRLNVDMQIRCKNRTNQGRASKPVAGRTMSPPKAARNLHSGLLLSASLLH